MKEVDLKFCVKALKEGMWWICPCKFCQRVSFQLCAKSGKGSEFISKQTLDYAVELLLAVGLFHGGNREQQTRRKWCAQWKEPADCDAWDGHIHRKFSPNYFNVYLWVFVIKTKICFVGLSYKQMPPLLRCSYISSTHPSDATLSLWQE